MFSLLQLFKKICIDVQVIYNVVLVSDGQQHDSVITYTLKAVDNLHSISFLIVFIFRAVLSESESCLVVSDSLQPHGLYIVHGIL